MSLSAGRTQNTHTLRSPRFCWPTASGNRLHSSKGPDKKVTRKGHRVSRSSTATPRSPTLRHRVLHLLGSNNLLVGFHVAWILRHFNSSSPNPCGRARCRDQLTVSLPAAGRKRQDVHRRLFISSRSPTTAVGPLYASTSMRASSTCTPRASKTASPEACTPPPSGKLLTKKSW